MAKEIPSQLDMILEHLQVYGTITPLAALREYRCFRLADVIFRLRKKYDIETEDMESGNKRYAKYRYLGEKMSCNDGQSE